MASKKTDIQNRQKNISVQKDGLHESMSINIHRKTERLTKTCKFNFNSFYLSVYLSTYPSIYQVVFVCMMSVGLSVCLSSKQKVISDT